MSAVPLTLDHLLAIAMGLSLAATCGLRAFLPLLTVSLLAWTEQLSLDPAFAWMGHPVAALCFGTAVLAEVIGDKVPAVDHALDALGVVVKPVAATLVTASFIEGLDPMLALVAGLISGGVVAEGVHLIKAKTRLLSSAFTATLANPFVSLAEDFVAVGMVVLSVLVPAVILVSVALVFVWALRRRMRAA